MVSRTDQPVHPGYVDFSLEIRPGTEQRYPVAARSPAGDVQATMLFPFGAGALENRLLALENAILRFGSTQRQSLMPDHRTVQDFGRALFDALFVDDVRTLYYQSQEAARLQGKGLRLKLRIEVPELAALPWEFLYDPRQADYVCLSTASPIVRDVGLMRPNPPLAVTPPLRILGMVASPAGFEPLDIPREQRWVEEALAGLVAGGLVELQWLGGQTWRDLQQKVRREGFHIFHFIGHGSFDGGADEGVIALAGEDGKSHLLPAPHLAMLLADESDLQLVVLNSCDGARGGAQDVFSSTASILIRRGIRAVLAMQYGITDRAAIEFARSFYEAIADGVPVDAAVADGRKAVRLAIQNTVEWATPVLYLRALDGALFDIRARSGVGGATQAAVPRPSPPPRPTAEAMSAQGPSQVVSSGRDTNLRAERVFAPQYLVLHAKREIQLLQTALLGLDLPRADRGRAERSLASAQRELDRPDADFEAVADRLEDVTTILDRAGALYRAGENVIGPLRRLAGWLGPLGGAVRTIVGGIG